ncbi:MAG: AAA family ATPase [Desulfobacterales bacterium]|nr:AAA family ATPase [Desulfobacterales bacterium]
MELLIKNFGPIKKGKIDLNKKFDLFVGYNNSGKTYVAQLMWAIFHPATKMKFVENLIKEKNELFDIESVDGKVEINDELIQKLLFEYSNFLISKTIPEIFKIKKNHFLLKKCSLEFIICDKIKIEEAEKKSSRVVVGANVDGTTRFEIFELEKRKGVLSIEIREKKSALDFSDYTSTNKFNKKEVELKRIILVTMLNILLKDEKPFYLPAARVFYPVFYEYIFRYEKERLAELSKKMMDMLASKHMLDEKDIIMYKSRYTEPMDALINKIFKLNEELTETSPDNGKFHEELEEIIGGKIILGRKEGVAPAEFYLMMKDGQNYNNLEMYLSSSSVNQLTTLYLFFKYWMEDNENYLIIDEPEENLHPENQVSLLNLLVKFSKNNKVLITSHSPLLTKALNNHIYLGILKENNVNIKKIAEQHDIDIDLNSSLSHEDIGIYFFDGGYIHNYKVKNYGVLFDDFKKVERKLENISEILTDEIYYFESESSD